MILRAPELLRRWSSPRTTPRANLPGPEAAVPPDRLQEVLSSPGHPLDAATRHDLSGRFGHDFGRMSVVPNASRLRIGEVQGTAEREANRFADAAAGSPPSTAPGPLNLRDVRLHTGASSAALARQVGAQAFAVGPHIVFGEGRYAPGTARGRHLIAHELAHCAQQRAAGPSLQRAPEEGAAAPASQGTGGSGYPTAWQAARAALEIYNPISIQSKDPNNRLDYGKEYGGLIYRHLDGTYAFTEAVSGEGGADASPTVDPWKALDKVPKELRNRIAGDYHTHGGGNEIASGEDFSGFHAEAHPISKEVITGNQAKSGDIYEGTQDISTHSANILNPQTYTLFLATPSGRFALFIPKQNIVFSFSPDSRLLPGKRPVPAASYAR